MADKNSEQNLKISERILQLRQKIAALQEKENELTEQEHSELQKLEGTLAKILKFQEKRLKEAFGTYQAELDIKKVFSSQASDLSSISSLYKGLTSKQQESLKTAQGIAESVYATMLAEDNKKEILQSTLDGVTQLQAFQQKMAETGPEDVETQEFIRDSYKAQENLLRESVIAKQGISEITQEEAAALLQMLETQKDNFEVAAKYGNVSSQTKEMIQSQLDAFEGMKKTVGGILSTMSMLTSGVRGGLGTGLILAGAAGKKLLDTSYQLGGSLLDASNISTTLFGTVFDDAAGATKALSEEFGGLNDVSLTTQFRTNVLAKNLGIGVSEAAKLTGAIARLNDGSAETAQNLIQATQNLAEQNGLVPADLMADVAASGEEFALFGKQGGKNILEAAVAAGKLGVNMKTISGIAESLLDFESSLTNELELSAMLGRNINLNRARALAYEGNIGEAVRETLSQLGGIEDFNRMDYFQKKQTAALLGVSVEEFQKMAENADKLNEKGEIQLTQYEKIWQTTKSVGSQLLSMGQGLGGLVIAAGQFSTGMGSIGGKIKDWFPSLTRVGDWFRRNPIPTTDSSDIGDVGNQEGRNQRGRNRRGGNQINSIVDTIGKIDMKKVVQGAAALVIIAGAMWVLGKAIQEYQDIGFDTLKVAGVALLGLTLALAAVGGIMKVAGPFILIGAAAMLVIAGSMWVLGKALQELSVGFQAMSLIQPILGGLVDMVVGIFILAGAFTALAASLTLLGIAGIAALPTLMGLAVAGAGLGLLFGVFGDDSTQSESVSDSGPSLNYQKQMVDKLDVLIAEVSKNRDIYLDGDKVSSVVFKRANRITKNSGVDLNTD